MSALEFLFGDILSKPEYQNPVSKRKVVAKKRKKSTGSDLTITNVKKEPTRGPHVRSIELKGTGEMISRYELNTRLVHHFIAPGTKLHSPKYGEITVKNGGGEDEPYTVVNEKGETV
jgi:hypothetical protein